MYPDINMKEMKRLIFTNTDDEKEYSIFLSEDSEPEHLILKFDIDAEKNRMNNRLGSKFSRKYIKNEFKKYYTDRSQYGIAYISITDHCDDTNMLKFMTEDLRFIAGSFEIVEGTESTLNITLCKAYGWLKRFESDIQAVGRYIGNNKKLKLVSLRIIMKNKESQK